MDTALLYASYGTASLYLEYGVMGLEYSTLDIAYGIIESEYEFSTLDIAYEIVREEVTEWEPTITPVSQWTQVIGNKYPTWHAARRRRGSTIQRVINSISGYHLDNFMGEISRIRLNNFIATTDLSELDQVFVAPLPSIKTELFSNLLFNSDFSTKALARLGTPWAWNDGLGASTGEISTIRNASLMGTYGARLAAGQSETTHIKQTLQLQVLENKYLTAGVYYAGMREELEASSHELHLMIQVLYTDSTMESWRKGLMRGSDGEWRFDSLTIQTTKETHTVRVAVVLDNRFGDQDLTVDVGGVYLVHGQRAVPWNCSPNDKSGYTIAAERESITETIDGSPLTYQRFKRLKLFPVETFEHLNRDALPHRVSLIEADGEEAINRNRITIRVDKDGSRFNIGWRVEDGVIVPYNADIALDETYGEYQIADTYSDSRYDESWYLDIDDLGVEQTCEALTVHRGLLFVVVTEEFLGRTTRSVKVCSPGLRWDDKNHLECIREIQLPELEGDCSFIGFVENSADRIVLTIDGVDYLGQFEFDDCYVSIDKLLLTRTQYSGELL